MITMGANSDTEICAVDSTVYLSCNMRLSRNKTFGSKLERNQLFGNWKEEYTS